jgi:flagellar basal-body rod protein FlgB
MFEMLEIFRMAQGLAVHAGERQSVIARNVANADTPGYRAQDIEDFAKIYEGAGDGLALKATRPGHIAAEGGLTHGARLVDSPDDYDPNGNTVSLEDEMVKAAEVRRQHDMALAVYRSSLGILRTSLGRSG